MRGTSSHLCLLIEKPDGCPQESFDKLHEVFEGDLCEEQDFPILGGPESLPPAYLSVPNHRDCLGKKTYDEHRNIRFKMASKFDLNSFCFE